MYYCTQKVVIVEVTVGNPRLQQVKIKVKRNQHTDLLFYFNRKNRQYIDNHLSVNLQIWNFFANKLSVSKTSYLLDLSQHLSYIYNTLRNQMF